jgi:hypothetical protein
MRHCCSTLVSSWHPRSLPAVVALALTHHPLFSCSPIPATPDRSLTLLGPPLCSQQGLLLSLPDALLQAILRITACPRSRELCRALLHLHDHIPHLTPRGVETADELLAALARPDDHHKHLASLNLIYVGDILTDDVLLALCTSLPNLCTLHLPACDSKLTVAGVAAATAHLPGLTALDVPDLSDVPWSYEAPSTDSDDDINEGDTIPTWVVNDSAHHLQRLRLPSALHVTSATALSRCTGLSALIFRGDGDIDIPPVAALVAQLPALVVLELEGNFRHTGSLQSLTRLTALQLWGQVGEREGDRLLTQLAALTNLRSLSLAAWWDDARQSIHPGWATALTALTSLRVTFTASCEHDPYEADYLALDDVALCVPHLPALRELHVSSLSDYCCAGLPRGACARIASASSSLRLLHVEGLRLPASMFAQVLARLTGLTCLRLLRNRHAATPFDWLGALTALRELQYTPRGALTDVERRFYSEEHPLEFNTEIGSGVLPCPVLAALSNVHALTLAGCPFVDAPYLEHLCAAMPQLRTLDLADTINIGAGLSALQRLTNLEVLDLEVRADTPEALLGHVRAPSSLRRCYLGWRFNWGPVEQATAGALPGGHVDTVFSHWEKAFHNGYTVPRPIIPMRVRTV